VTAYLGPVIDVDVHHLWRSTAELLEYLPGEWRDYARATGANREVLMMPGRVNNTIPDGTWRIEAKPATGGPPGSDYETTRRQLLDPLGAHRVLLNFDIGMQSGFPNPYFAVALCRAANDWTVDRWLSLPDQRIHGSILIPTELADEGAAEIRRLAGHPRVAQALLVCNSLGKPFGHPHYRPIFAAAQDVGLPVAIHVGGEGISKGREMAGGHAGTFFERYCNIHQSGMHYLTSLITHAVFERFPRLRLMISEFGFTWLPFVSWRLDSMYRVLRTESPQVKRLPSECIREHVRFSTQPFEHIAGAAGMTRLLESYPDFEHLLCFATDYPHWDADEPRHVASRLPRGWAPRVFFENAAAFYGGPAPVEQAASPAR
jgi:uncharacterized protein